MHVLDDVARFYPDEAEVLVEASFACPLCLRRASAVAVREEVCGCRAGCRCAVCEIDWTVLMSDEQMLRIRLAPPERLHIASVASARDGR